ncbi:hypothetical protein T01_1573, partial [Trichinella spiralis]
MNSENQQRLLLLNFSQRFLTLLGIDTRNEQHFIESALEKKELFNFKNFAAYLKILLEVRNYFTKDVTIRLQFLYSNLYATFIALGCISVPQQNANEVRKLSRHPVQSLCLSVRMPLITIYH